MNELKTHICQFCHKSYESDGSRKPKSFKKDGSVYQYYDSSSFCSKKCCQSYSHEKQRQTIKNNPEIMKKLHEKRLQTLKNNPDIEKKSHEKQRQTFKNNPEILKKRTDKVRTTLKQTYRDHPEIIEKSRNKAYQTAKTNGFISKTEQQMIQLLKNKYGGDDVIEQYRDIRYSKPGTKYRYACDCYVKSLDLFIEYSGSRFHPKEEDRDKLLQEITTFKQKYPNRDIKECQANTLLKTIENDKIKQQVAKDNKLNYLIVTEEFKELYNNKILSSN